MTNEAETFDYCCPQPKPGFCDGMCAGEHCLNMDYGDCCCWAWDNDKCDWEYFGENVTDKTRWWSQRDKEKYPDD